MAKTEPKLILSTINKPIALQSYNDMQITRDQINEKNDCGVVALALAGGIPYLEANRVLALYGRKPKASTFLYQIHEGLSHIGLVYEEIDLPKETTLRALSRSAWAYKGIYLVFTASHVACMRDGMLIDWAIDTQRRITNLYKITDECPF